MSLELCDCSLPATIFIVTERLWLYGKEESLIVLLRGYKSWYCDCIVCHQLDRLFKRWLLFNFFDLIVRIAHDCDKHVEEGDLSDESWENEEDPDHCIVIWRLDVGKVIIAKRQHVLVHQCIYEGHPEKVVEDPLVIVATNIYDHKSVAESHKQEDEHDEEAAHVIYRVFD